MLASRSEGPVEYHELGICFYLLSNHEQSLEYLEILKNRFPDYIEEGNAALLRILCLIHLERFTEALQELTERLPRSEYDTRLLNMHVYVLEKLGRMDDAIRVAEQILAIVPEDANARNSLGYLLSRRGTASDLARAGSHIKKAITLSPTSAAYLDSLGVYLLKQGQIQGARAAFEKALRFAPDNTLILDHLREIARMENQS